jgi:hypothetical protein
VINVITVFVKTMCSELSGNAMDWCINVCHPRCVNAVRKNGLSC